MREIVIVESEDGKKRWEAGYRILSRNGRIIKWDNNQNFEYGLMIYAFTKLNK